MQFFQQQSKYQDAYLMKVLLSVSLLLISISCNAMFTPGESLKSPTELLEKIAEFRKKYISSTALERQWNKSKEEWAEDARQAEQLGSNALLAYVLCDTYLDDVARWKDNPNFVKGDEAAIGQSGTLIAFYQGWSRDPFRFQTFKGSTPEKITTEYTKMMNQEREKFIADLTGCEKHKIDLMQQIKFLNESVIQSKLKSGNIS